MSIIDIEDYKEIIKSERTTSFTPPYDLVYEMFLSLGYDKKDMYFFEENASMIVEQLREKCWEKYYAAERTFTSNMLKRLVTENEIKDKTPYDAIIWFAENYPEHIYQLNLSNTNSRRSRAGKEFESIIELVLLGAGIPMDSQGNIGKKTFVERGLGKLVDAVSPGTVEFEINKRNAVLVSAKTTLRERWQEVPEEMGRTGAREMFLATLDENITQEVLDTLYEANIQVTTTRNNKQKNYQNNDRVLDFEELIEICKSNNVKWKRYNYTDAQINKAIESIEIQLDKHVNHEFVKESLIRRINMYKDLLH